MRHCSPESSTAGTILCFYIYQPDAHLTCLNKAFVKRQKNVNAIQGMLSKGINAELEPIRKPQFQPQGSSEKGPLFQLQIDPLRRKGLFPNSWDREPKARNWGGGRYLKHPVFARSEDIVPPSAHGTSTSMPFSHLFPASGTSLRRAPNFGAPSNASLAFVVFFL